MKEKLGSSVLMHVEILRMVLPACILQIVRLLVNGTDQLDRMP